MFEIGSSLRDARVRKGLDLTELETETKIRAKYLRALEEERFDLLPGDTYVKGFLRVYAERLGLDGQLYVDEYNSRFSLGEEPVIATRSRRRARQGRFEAHAVLVALAGIIAVTVLVIAAWQFGSENGGAPPGTTAATTGAGDTAETVPESSDAAAAAGAVVVRIAARKGSSRIEVRRGSRNGELLYEGTLERGESQRFTGEELWAVVAKPANVSVDGESIAGLGPGPVTVRITARGIERVPSP